MKDAAFQGSIRRGIPFPGSNLTRWAAMGGMLVLAAGQAAGQHIDVPFTGPASTHVSYNYTYIVDDGEVEFRVDEQTIRGVAGLEPTLSGTYHHTGLGEGSYRYEIRRRHAGGAWEQVAEATVELDGKTAAGTLLFDESLNNCSVGSISVPEDYTLTLSGTIEAVGSPWISVWGDIVFLGAVLDSVGVTLATYQTISWDQVRGGFFSLRHAYSVSGAAHSTFILVDAVSTFTDCETIDLRPIHVGVNLSNVSNAVLQLDGLTDDDVVTVTDNTSLSSQVVAAKGQFILRDSTWNGTIWFRGTSEVDAERVKFPGKVDVGYGYHQGHGSGGVGSEPMHPVRFTARDCTFNDLTVTRVRAGHVALQNCRIAGPMLVGGGFASFAGCEFGANVQLANRCGASFQTCRVLGQLYLSSIHPDRLVWEDAPRWHEAATPSPTIQNNAFMGQVALDYSFSGENAKPDSPVSIGANYYGDPSGFLLDIGHGYGFLGYSAGHLGAKVYDASVFDLATALSSSPLSGSRKDTRVFPKFWTSGHIAGQNTISHSRNYDSFYAGPLLKGRDTLFSVHVIASDDDLGSVRAYAEWMGGEVNSLPRAGLHRDRSRYSEAAVRNGRATFNFVLPGGTAASEGPNVQKTVRVFLDRTSISGFDDEAMPAEDPLLASATLVFTNQPARPLRIAVQPIRVRGTFGGDWGAASAGSVIRHLKRDLPDMLPLPASKLEVTQLPLRTFWSPTSVITTGGLLNRIAAGAAMGRWLSSLGRDYIPDFVVFVLPKGLGASFDGASFALRRRIVFVAEHRADAVLHELGHGVGLYTGLEQYTWYPPNGLRVERATRFPAETRGRNAVDQIPGKQDFWYALDKNDDEVFYYMDIMGRIGPAWANPETVKHFHDWFQANLTAAPAAPTATRSTGVLNASSGTRILLSGVYSGDGHLDPESITCVNVTDEDFEPLPAPESGYWWNRHQLIPKDAHGAPMDPISFSLPDDGPVLTATFDLPEGAVSFCIERTAGGVIEEVYCLQPLGLQSTRLLTPRPGDAIGLTFLAEWESETTQSTEPSDLQHTLFYKTAPGADWIAAFMTEGTQIVASSSFLPDTDFLALRLVSSDGLATREHVIEGLSVPPRPPAVAILHPLEGDYAIEETEWHLDAFVENDRAEGVNEGVWTSNRDGELGQGPVIGATLSLGTHVLRYEVDGANGLTGHAEVTVHVAEEVESLDLDLGLSTLVLANKYIDPAGYTEEKMLPGATNTLVMTLRNQGVEASARMRLFVRPPTGPETLIGTRTVAMQPFQIAHAVFLYEPAQEGEHTIRAVVDEVVPTDPDAANNTREWVFDTYPPDAPRMVVEPRIVQLRRGYSESFDIQWDTDPHNVEIRNEGNEPLNLQSVTVLGGPSHHFRIENYTGGATLPPGGATNLTLRGRFIYYGEVRHARLRVESDCPANPVMEALLFATIGHDVDDIPDDDGDGLLNIVERYIGTDPQDPDTTGNGLTDWDELLADVCATGGVLRMAGDLDFGEVAVGESAERTLSLRNLGVPPIQVGRLDGPSGFAADAPPPLSLASLGSLDIAVTFSPGAGGVYGGRFEALSDAERQGPARPCFGTGLPPGGLTPSGIPVNWLLDRGFPTDGSADHTDPLNKGSTLREDYMADTEPRDATDLFRFDEVFPAGGAPHELAFGFRSSINRFYSMRYAPTLAPGNWLPVPGVGPRRGVGGADQITVAIPGTSPGFFLLIVELP